MKKVKDFIKEHKWTIINGAVGTVIGGTLCGLGCYAGYGYCLKHKTVLADGITKEVIDNAIEQYHNNLCVHGRAIHNGGYKPIELGRLGEDMMDTGAPADKVFTHFIAFAGPDKK